MMSSEKSIDIQQALQELGVSSNTLTLAEVDFLNENGYLLLTDILSPDEVAACRQRLEELTLEEGYSAGAVDQTAYQLKVNRAGQGMLSGLVAYCYNALFWMVRAVAWRLLFKYNPKLRAKFTTRSGHPRPLKNTIPKKIQAEIREMLYAAAANEPGIVRLCDLVNKGSCFEPCFTHPRVLAAVNQILGPKFKLSSLNYRNCKPGFGFQPLHVDDSEGVFEADKYHGCNTFWLLDEFTENNGATRVVPGSHKIGQKPKYVLSDIWGPHPQQKSLLAPAGTVVVVNAHTWHSGTLNRFKEQRRMIQSYFVRQDIVQQLNQREYIRTATIARLSQAAQIILDVPGSCGFCGEP